MSRKTQCNTVLAVLAIVVLTLSATGTAIHYSITDSLRAYADKGSDDDNSGPGSRDDDDNDDHDDDDRDKRLNRLLAAPQDPSAVTSIIIPVDAESHSAENPYSPNPATVSSGSAVTWNNVDDDLHSATADDGSFSTGILEPGESGQAIINAPAGATIPYHCDVHPEMIGLLRVGAAVGGNAESNTAKLELTSRASPLLRVSDQPLAIGQYSTVSKDFAGNANRASLVGNTIITLPNSSETITANSTGIFLTFTESAGTILEGQVHLTTPDGTEEATITMIEFLTENAPGIGIASFSTNSTNRLAPLDSIVAVTLYTHQPDGSAKIMFFEWHAGPLIDNNQAETISNNLGNDTHGNNQTTTSQPPSTVNQSGGSTVTVSIGPGATSKASNAFSPNPVQIKVGDSVIWTNDDTLPHTVTSGSNGQPDGIFNSSPNLSPLMATGHTFGHTFEQAGEFPYYCALHPNMVGTVSVS